MKANVRRKTNKNGIGKLWKRARETKREADAEGDL